MGELGPTDGDAMSAEGMGMRGGRDRPDREGECKKGGEVTPPRNIWGRQVGEWGGGDRVGKGPRRSQLSQKRTHGGEAEGHVMYTTSPRAEWG